MAGVTPEVSARHLVSFWVQRKTQNAAELKVLLQCLDGILTLLPPPPYAVQTLHAPVPLGVYHIRTSAFNASETGIRSPPLTSGVG
ncbi:hypothetical protein JZ751_013632, partial [Albula glossodonta]